MIVSSILGVGYQTALIIISGVFIIYTVMGGLYSVVYTDLIQTGILVVGVLLAFPFVMSQVGGFSTMQTAIAQINPQALNPVAVAGGSLGVISTFLSFSIGIAAQQYYLVRIYSAKDLPTAKFMIAASSAIWSVLGIVLVFLGVAARVLLPELAAADSAIIELGALLPPAIEVMLLIGLACAIMSTTDTVLLLAGTYLGRDLYKALVNPNATDDQTVTTSRIAVCIVGVASAILALNPPELIINLTTFTTSVSAATFFAPMLLGFFWQETTREGALAGAILGGASAILWQLFSPLKIPAALPSTAFSFLVIYLVSAYGPQEHRVKLPAEQAA